MRFKNILIGTAVAILASTVSAFSSDIRDELYQPRDFNKVVEGEVHISSFVFNDLAADGNYGLGDTPIVDVYVSLKSEDGSGMLVPTNIDGFANFNASSTQEDAQIKLPGKYTFEVIPPPGWQVTTGNALQTIEIEDKIGSPGGLVAKTVPTLVGITREGAGSAGPLSPHPLIRGSGKLTVLPEAGATTKIGFDDIIGSIGIKKMPNGYHGLNWQNWVVSHQRFYKGEGYINGTTSGEFIAYNGSAHPMAVYREKPFDFIGGNFTAAWRESEGEILHVKAWRGEELAYKDDIKLSRFGPVFFQANYDQVTRIEFETEHYWQVVTDDLHFRLD